MTKGRARKQAARQRAAETGERYVVARRSAAEPVASGSALHDLTHRVPGVPEHVEGGYQRRARRNPVATSGHQGRSNPAHGEPRVLVGWQERIARFFGAE
jgi:hypothetical protein